MKIPIPDDWSSGEWQCFQIQWPKSDFWLGIFVGLLTQVQRGYFWDEKTGTITDVQAIADEIWRRNHPFISCDGEGTEGVPDSDYIHMIGALCSADSEEIMSLCGYNPKAFKIENGSLWVRDFCGEWVEIGEVGLTATPPIDDEIDYPSDAVFSACGKAFAMVDLIKRVGNSIWDQRDNDPYTGWTNIDNAYPNIMSLGYTWNAIIAAVDIAAIGYVTADWYGPELFDESAWQSILCSLTASLNDDALLPDKDTLFSLIEGKIDAQWPLDPLAQSFWWNVMKAIGENDIRNAGLAGATDVNRDCDCPALPPTLPSNPTENGWYLSPEFVLRVYDSGAYNTPLCLKAINQHEAFGVVFTCFWDEPDFASLKRMAGASAGCSVYDLDAWGDTSDHLEYEPQGHYYACGNSSVLNELLGVGNYTQKSSNYGEDTDPATGGIAKYTVINHAFFGDDMETGKYYEIHIRFIFNENSPSHS